MATSGYGCVRHTFTVVNAILLMAGCGLLGSGLWLRLSHGSRSSLLPENRALGADVLLMIAGAAAAAVTFCGCCGSCCRNRALLMTYFSAVAAAFLLELLALTLALAFRLELEELLRSELLAGLRQHYSADSGLAHTWDRIQLQFECCGVDSHQDWFSITAWPNSTMVPDSCCLPQFNVTGCGESGQPAHWYTTGCFDMIHVWLLQRLHMLGMAALALVFIQLFGLVASMMLFCTIGYKRRRMYTYRSYDCTASLLVEQAGSEGTGTGRSLRSL